MPTVQRCPADDRAFGRRTRLLYAMPRRIAGQVANPVLTRISNHHINDMIYPDPICRLRDCGKLLEVPRCKALMALRVRSTTRLPLSRLVSVSICLCAFAVLPLPQLGVLTWTESAEANHPCQENGESSEQELVVCSSARRRLNDQRHSDHSRPHETGNGLHHIASFADSLPTIVGHHLANGRCSPLLI